MTEQRMGSTWRMTVNEKQFIETALLKDLRIDGRRPFDYRPLNIKLVREDGVAEVHLGQTHVTAYATCQLVQPYKDRPNEGTLAIFTEFSPMADPSFEVGRPEQSAVELGRVVDRGLRESKAIDMESLAVVAGKYVWAIRLDIHILDNCGNLIDAANIAALAALLTFRRPECTISGVDGQEVTIHPPEIREPLQLVIHHLPVAITFAFFNEGNLMVIDPTYNEEAVMGGRMTATINMNGEVCGVQKAGGEGITSSVSMQCLRIASMKAADITKEIKDAVELYDSERTLRKVKRHSSLAVLEVDTQDTGMRKNIDEGLVQNIIAVKDDPDTSCPMDTHGCSRTVKPPLHASNWDPYSTEVSSILSHRADSQGTTPHSEQVVETVPVQNLGKLQKEKVQKEESGSSGPKSLVDAVKPKNRRRKKKQ